MKRATRDKKKRRQRQAESMRRFQAHEEALKGLRRHLELIADALCHDYQFDIREACRILEILALPKRLTREGQFYQLEKMLGLKREAQGWGRPWSSEQLRRMFYAKGRDFQRILPRPVTQEEVERWTGPTAPPKRKLG